LTKRIAAILMCAVMVLVAAAPLALATHDVIKGAQGPRASAVTWKYVPVNYGIWTGHIVNNGLRSLVVDVADNTTGTPVDMMHQRIRFAVYDAYPIGTVDTAVVIMAAGRLYEITVMPNGPQGSTCTVDDMFKVPPVAAITVVSQDYLNVVVDGSGSTDADGVIESYAWAFGDGSIATGVTASHSYAENGTYTITLGVKDNDGLTDTADQLVTVVAKPPEDTSPVAAFTFTVNGLTVNVDASTSSDDKGINAYDWTWDDGTTGSGKTATHTYATSMVSGSAISGKAGAPGPPHGIVVSTFDAGGNPMNGAIVTVTNMRTGEVLVWDETREFWDPTQNTYIMDGSEFTLVVPPATQSWVYGDILNVTATKGTNTGWTEAPMTENPSGYDVINVVLLPMGGSFTKIITLTVTDTIGQTNSVSWPVTLTW